MKSFHQPGVPGTVKWPTPRPERDGDDFVIKVLGGEEYRSEVYALGECRVMVGQEPGADGLGWHLSISHPRRYPTWDEIKAARYLLIPAEVTMAMLLPPPEEYVNIPAQDNVFHCWQIPGDEKGRQ